MFQKFINAIGILSFFLHVVYISTGIVGYRIITSEGFLDSLLGIGSLTEEIKPNKFLPEF